MRYKELVEKVHTANLVLVGLGEDLTGDLDSLYRSLAVLLEGKDYFIVRAGRTFKSQAFRRTDCSAFTGRGGFEKL